MTSTLAQFYGSPIRVDLLQSRECDELYLREVFLRTVASDQIVEYGVIAVALDQYTPPQQDAIRAGQTPLGALLHRFRIPFESAPIGFFAVPTSRLAEKHREALGRAECFGRFNQLAKPTGEPLAWIMEILPHAAS
jgi:chorismate-pyruvate lyase